MERHRGGPEARLHVRGKAEERDTELTRVPSGEPEESRPGRRRPTWLLAAVLAVALLLTLPIPIMVSMLGDAKGDGPGGFLLIDDQFNVKGRWEKDTGNMKSNYDFWYQPRHNVMVSSEWAAPNTVKRGFKIEDLNAGKYGHHLHFWDWSKRQITQSVDLGEEQLGADSQLVGDMLNDRSLIASRAKRWDEAISYAERALEIRREEYGERSVQVAASLRGLAEALAADGEPGQALELVQGRLQLPVQALGDFGDRLGPVRLREVDRVSKSHQDLGKSFIPEGVLDRERDRRDFPDTLDEMAQAGPEVDRATTRIRELALRCDP